MDKDNLEKVPQGMMDELNHVAERINPHALNTILMNTDFLIRTPLIQDWYLHSNEENRSKELKLIKHIWLHDPQFKEEKSKKYIVRSKSHDGDENYKYLVFSEDVCLSTYELDYHYNLIVKFNTKEEAEKWVNPQFEVVEVEE